MTAVIGDTGSATKVSGDARHALLRGQGLAGLILVGVIVLAGLFAGVLSRQDPVTQITGANLLPPTAEHWLGTDELNRDVLARVLHGLRVDLLIVFVAVPLAAVLGSAIGLLAGVNAAVDTVAQRVFDVVLAFPALILAIALAAITGPGAHAVVIVIVAAEVPVFGRQIRTAILRVREQAFVEAAEVIGAGTWWTVRKHVLPNVLEPLAVQLALSMSIAVAVDGAMSFIGLGVRPPQPSLGSVIAESISNMDANPAMAVGPLVVVAGLTLGFLLIAQGLGRARRIA
ncbi:peptide/nickel transport system permease protein [Nocardia transvalensis]|uniref:Peptide/nickel transport system permease protein n=1 Tax=Nocardia transvalensis TaxID=37333 RepID=A0A7W9UGG6_9NOCA|nr:ABC transporter permease [Nocardia transvalensis]MBB5912258.1 peptide/nickel transport system permease protein [Nocardia transvalensis]